MSACAQVMGQPVLITVQGGVKVAGEAALSARVTKAVNRVLEAMRPVKVEV